MIADFLNLFRLIAQHSLTRHRRLSAWQRFIRWQVGSRLIGCPGVMPWVGHTRLIVARGMTGATGNLYCGLHEFPDMGFVLHFLHPDDLFLDVGANVGTYTVLAAGVAGSQVIAFEPIPETYTHLLDNVRLNNLGASVEALNIALGADNGSLHFSSELDTENHVLPLDAVLAGPMIPVPVARLDDVLGDRRPAMIKMDVEGFETEVLRGGVQAFSSPCLEAVLIELNGAGNRYGFSDDAIRAGFAERGFVPCRYEPLSRCLTQLDEDAANKTVTGNTLYIRDMASVQLRLLQAPAFRILGQSI